MFTDFVQRWAAGNATVTSIVEDQTDGIPPKFFFPGLASDDIQRIPWLDERYTSGDGTIGLRVQATVIEVAGHLAVVDPCIGNGKRRHQPFWDRQNWPFMKRFDAAGFDPEKVDLVVHTHLHVDHVGWGTRFDGDQWIPTFPNARYVYVAGELDRLRTFPGEDDKEVYTDSVEPIFAAGLAELVDNSADIGCGLQFAATPGHTPDHASLWFTSGDARVLITGDAVHHPFQIARPDIGFTSDDQPELARETRTALLRQVATLGCHVFGTHFPTLPYGRVVPDRGTWRFHPEEPA
jgi:glyoxylase-like metal-dependent hydrolase (beta-lactamase superfamily II)